MDKQSSHKAALDAEIKAFGSVCRIKSSSASPKGDRRLNPMNVDLIIHKLLSYLPLHELKAAREVNRHWNQIASQFFYPYCSKVVLSFNDDNYWTNSRNYGINEMKDFIHLVQVSEECPFLNFDIGTSILQPSNREGIVSEFFQVCGPYMQELTIREDCGKRPFRKGLPLNLNFESLTTLRIQLLQAYPEILNDFFDFINVIVQAAPELEHIILMSHHGFDEGETVSCLIHTLLLCDVSKIRRLEIEAQMSEVQLVSMSTLGLRLKNLSVDFWGSHILSTSGMKTFLESQSDSLETFKLSDVAMSSLCIIEFPCMRQLQTLKIKGSMLGRISVTFPHISFVDQFPKLRTLSFTELVGEWEEFLKTGMKPSLTVQELKLPCDFCDVACLRRSAYIFPHLKKLEVPSHPLLINVVYEQMPNLEELSINTRYVSLIDDVITGVPQELCAEINRERCYDLVMKDLDGYQNSRSITCLKKLKTLSLKCKRTSDPCEITEVSFYLALFQMKSLVSLDFGLRPLMLSRECMDDIRERFSVVSLHIHQ